MLRFVRPKTPTLETIVMSGVFEIGSYIVVYVDIVKAGKKFEIPQLDPLVAYV